MKTDYPMTAQRDEDNHKNNNNKKSLRDVKEKAGKSRERTMKNKAEKERNFEHS